MDLAQFWNNSGGYEIDQSLRFDTDQYLQRTNGSAATDGQYGTLSVWFKLANSTDLQTIIEGSNSTYGHFFRLTTGFKTDLHIGVWGSVDGGAESNAVFRDNSAWYHFLWQFDKTQSGVTNVNKLWVNGVSIAQTAAGTFSSQNWGVTNNGSTTVIGNYKANGSTRYGHLKSYMAEMHVIDGSLKAATDFGETDTTTGAWIPKRYTGSYGTNGFYLKFDPAATNGIGHDHSGNGNNFTATGFTTSGTGTDVMSDTPTTNWCTLNPIFKENTGVAGGTFANGNLEHSEGSINFRHTISTLALPSSGKVYVEVEANTLASSYGSIFGLMLESKLNSPDSADNFGIYCQSNGTLTIEGTNQGTVSAGDIFSLSVDMGASPIEIVVRKNNSVVGSNPYTLSTTETLFFWSRNIYGSKLIWNFGQRAFAYTPPTGYKALNTANLPEPTIKDGGKYFNTVLYTGNGSTRTISGVGFQPDLVWIKDRTGTAGHALHDAVRTSPYRLNSSVTNAESDESASFTGFASDGFSLAGNDTTYNNNTPRNYVAWCWDAGGAGSSNNAGTITSTVSANASAGFSIVTYTGTGSAATVGHGLGVAPSFYVVKPRSVANNWPCYHKSLTSANYYIHLNSTLGEQAASVVWNGTAPSSTVFNIGTNTNVNQSGETFVAYCFSEVAGYSKFGSYTGNGSSDGPFVFCGFRPRWILVKRTDSTGTWEMYDTARDTYNVMSADLAANLSDAEVSQARFDALSNGFKNRITGAASNASGGTYIFAAFAELPFKYANAR